MKLEVELIPETQWGLSLAQLLPREKWNEIRRLVYRRHNWTCQICRAHGIPVHCHEVWEYDDELYIQKLKDFNCLCGDCHNIKHWGRTIQLLHEGKLTQGYIDYLRKHFCKINECTEQDMINHIVEAGDKNLKRSRHKYKLDLSNLSQIMVYSK